MNMVPKTSIGTNVFQMKMKSQESYLQGLTLNFCVKAEKQAEGTSFFKSLLPSRTEQASLHNDTIHLLIVTVHDDVTTNPAHS